MPQAVDTPLFQHAANYSGRRVQVGPPMLRPESVARILVRMARLRRPPRERFAGNVARFSGLLDRIAHDLTERLMALIVEELHLSKRERAPISDGNLFAPMAFGTGTRGGWRPLGRHPKAEPDGEEREEREHVVTEEDIELDQPLH
jgi:hypothetical protein